MAHLQLGNELCWVALDSVQYPGNLGTILRTSDAVGGAGIMLLDQTTDPYDPVAVRASMGAILSQRLIRTGFAAFAAWKASRGGVVVGRASDASTDYRALDNPAPVVLLMGCERLGLSSEQRMVCDAVVKIPMRGRADSLNLAIATGLILYEVFRQRHPPIP